MQFSSQISCSISCSSPSIDSPVVARMARVAKHSGRSNVILSLSPVPVPWSARQDDASDLPMEHPGRWCMAKSNLERYRDHLACHLLSFLANMKYSRFL